MLQSHEQDLAKNINQKFDLLVPSSEDIDGLDADLLGHLSKLIVERRTASALTDVTYLEKQLQTIDTRNDETEDGKRKDQTIDTRNDETEDQTEDGKRKDSLFTMYLMYRKYELGMNDIVEDYEDGHRLESEELEMARVTIFVLIFHLNKFNVDEVKNILFEFNPSKTKRIVKFLSSYNIASTMCKYFDREHVQTCLKVKETQCVIRKLRNSITQRKVTFADEKPRFVCKPFTTHYVRPEKLVEPIQEGAGDQKFVFKAKPVPFDILYRDEDEIIKQKEEKLMKREIEAVKMLEEANKNMFRVAKRIGEKKDCDEGHKIEPLKVNKIKAKKVQNFLPVKIKTNTAQTLREAALVIKEEERFEKMIHSLSTGSLCGFEYENFLEEMRKQREVEELENIERKKIQALITHEEAILAKKRLIEKNKNEKNQFCKEWEDYEKAMNDKREKEMQEMKLQFYIDAKQREKSIQEKMKNIVDEKSKFVQEENRKLKEDQDRRMVEINEEIARKKELVCQIKFLQEIAKLNNENRTTFDETEVTNNGLMYEMSLAELKMRLEEMEIEMKLDLEKKKAEIIEERAKKQKFLENTAKLVEDARNAKRETREFMKEIKSKCVQKKSNYSTDSNMDLKQKLMKVRLERVALESGLTVGNP